jgi:hypothetical protein
MLLTGENIEPTKSTPEVVLDPAGIIIIRGRSMAPNLVEFSKQIEDWICKYVSNPADFTRVDFYLEYLDSSNFKIFISLLSKIKSVKLKDKNYIINWYYDEGDEDIIEKGEYISSVAEVPFNFIMIPNRNDI